MRPEPERTCERVAEYHDGMLDTAGATRFRQHLESCDSCRAELAALRKLDLNVARAWQSVEPPELPAWKETLQRGMARGQMPERDRRLRRTSRFRGVAAAILVAASLGLVARLNMNNDPGRGARLYRPSARPADTASAPLTPGPPARPPADRDRDSLPQPVPVVLRNSEPWYAAASFPGDTLVRPVGSTPEFTVYAIVPKRVEKTN